MKTKGFTLIEIIVSLAIFSVVAVIAIGALVRVTSANRQAQAIQSGVNNVSFALDAMSREMRVGTNYACYHGSGVISSGATQLNLIPSSCSSNTTYTNPGDTIISFTSSDGLLYAYLFSNPSGVSTTTVYKAEATTGGQSLLTISFYPLTSQSVNITDYHVGIYSGSSYPYHLVFVRLKGYVGVKIKDQSVFDVETTVSDRSQ